MIPVTLRVRDLGSGTGSVQTFDTIEAAVAWLGARPRDVEVLGVVFEGLTREDNDRMKAAMRPLDDDERAKAKALDERDSAARAALSEKRARDQTQLADAQAAHADPNRPIELRYRYDREGLDKVDPRDEREITEAAQKAVLEWVSERMEWVASRGQTVGEAKVTVYLGDVPAKRERVVGGSFLPVTAPPKGEN